MVKRILIVDDDAELAQELAEVLRDCGFSVDNISDSINGKTLIEQNSYDIYLLDYKMSGLNGIDLLKRIKEKNMKSLVFIVSGRPFIENVLKEENVDSLVAGVIKKPFDVEALLQTIKSVAIA